MTHQEILTKAIEKAHQNGWVGTVRVGGYYIVDEKPTFVVEFRDRAEPPWERFIFDHDFSKALWPDKLILLTYTVQGFDVNSEERHKLKAWEYHLQQMVIADDPIKYLGDNLPEDKE